MRLKDLLENNEIKTPKSVTPRGNELKNLKIELEDNGYVVRQQLTVGDYDIKSLELHYGDSKANRELYEEYNFPTKRTKGNYDFFKKTVESYKGLQFFIVPHMLMIEIY